MRKKLRNLLLYPNHSNRRQKGQKSFCTLLGIAATLTTTGLLAPRFRNQKVRKSHGKRLSQKVMLKEIHESLMHTIPHDLRTPLSGILGNSLLYLESHETLEEAEKLHLVSQIHEDSGWLLNIVENLLAINRIRDTENAINTKNEVVEEVLGEALQKLKMRHPNFEVHATIPNEMIVLPIDALLIEQVIINLLENALVHSGSKEPVDILVENGKDYVTFTVRDYGQGIPDKVLDTMLDASTLAKATLVPHKKIGIGLFICKAIISAHHGTFLGRNHSQGAEFIFTLPKRSK